MNKETFNKILPHKNFEDFKPHKNGGGLVEKTAKVEDSAYIGENALVYDRAQIMEHVFLDDHAHVYGDVKINGHVTLKNHSVASGHAMLGGFVMMMDRSRVSDYACLYGFARMMGDSMLLDQASAGGYSVLRGNSCAMGDVKLVDNAELYDNAKLVCYGTLNQSVFTFQYDGGYALTLQLNSYVNGSPFVLIGPDYYSAKKWLEIFNKKEEHLFSYAPKQIKVYKEILKLIDSGDISYTT